MKKILAVAIGRLFSGGSTRTAILPFVALGLGFAFWMATTPVAMAQDSEGTFVLTKTKPGKDRGGKGDGGGGNKCKVCHRTGKPGKFITLNISCNAVQAHLNHGDSVGECAVTPTQNP